MNIIKTVIILLLALLIQSCMEPMEIYRASGDTSDLTINSQSPQFDLVITAVENENDFFAAKTKLVYGKGWDSEAQLNNSVKIYANKPFSFTLDYRLDPNRFCFIKRSFIPMANAKYILSSGVLVGKGFVTLGKDQCYVTINRIVGNQVIPVTLKK